MTKAQREAKYCLVSKLRTIHRTPNHQGRFIKGTYEDEERDTN